MDDTSRTCPICGTTSFHIDAGLTYCANGHEQGAGFVAAEDEADFLRTRGGKLHRDAVKEKKSRGGDGGKGERGQGRVLRGSEGWELWAKGWGRVLWGVCVGVVRMMGLGEGEGEEVWRVVRGLWEVRLGVLVEEWEGMRVGQEGMGVGEGLLTGEETSATEDDEGVTDAEEGGKKMKVPKGTPKLIDAAALVYLALLLMRRPLSLSRLYAAIQREEVSYIRAVRHLPQDLRERLAPEYYRALDTTTILRQEELQLAVHRNAKLYGEKFRMVLPPINWQPLLLEWVERLALPLEVYPLVKKLAGICDLDFTYQISGGGRRSVLSFPEAQLAALLVMAVKLSFPFDGEKRYPGDSSGTGLVRLDWAHWEEAKTWFEQASRAGREEVLEPGSEVKLKDVDLLKMKDREIDAYMDWYQDMWMGHRDEGVGVQRELLAMFPVNTLPATDVAARAVRAEERVKVLRQRRLERVLDGLKPARVITDKDLEALTQHQEGTAANMLRPGFKYESFLRMEDLQGVVRVFHEEAAEVACLNLKQLVEAVSKTENMVERWRREKKRTELFGDQDDEAMNVDAQSEEEVADDDMHERL